MSGPHRDAVDRRSTRAVLITTCARCASPAGCSHRQHRTHEESGAGMFIDSRSVEHNRSLKRRFASSGQGSPALRSRWKWTSWASTPACSKAAGSSPTTKRAICIAAKTSAFPTPSPMAAAAASWAAAAIAGAAGAARSIRGTSRSATGCRTAAGRSASRNCAPYYARTHALLQARPAEFRSGVLGSGDRPRTTCAVIRSQAAMCAIPSRSSARRCASARPYRDELSGSRHVRVLLHANVLEHRHRRRRHSRLRGSMSAR